MSLNLFLPKTFKPAKWKRLHEEAMDFECVMLPNIPERETIILHSETVDCRGGLYSQAFIEALVNHIIRCAECRKEMGK